MKTCVTTLLGGGGCGCSCWCGQERGRRLGQGGGAWCRETGRRSKERGRGIGAQKGLGRAIALLLLKIKMITWPLYFQSLYDFYPKQIRGVLINLESPFLTSPTLFPKQIVSYFLNKLYFIYSKTNSQFSSIPDSPGGKELRGQQGSCLPGHVRGEAAAGQGPVLGLTRPEHLRF